jgi:acetyl esterase/lipase
MHRAFTLLASGLMLSASIVVPHVAGQSAAPGTPSLQKPGADRPSASKTSEADPTVPLPKSGKGDIREQAKIQDPVKAPPPGKADPTVKPAAKAAPKATPDPTTANVPYGDHERQVLDFWKSSSDKATPLLFFIHGGGWVNGDKSGVGNVQPYLDAGISVVSINYRYNTQAQIAGVKPPVSWPLGDAARALQFVRSKAAEWNIDKQRIGASGGSAGACSSLYLAFHDDMSDLKSSDPIARESTRLWCAAVNGAQTTLDPQQMKEWTPNSRYGGHAFGFMPDPKDKATRDTQFAAFLAAREEVLPWIKKYSPYEHVSKDDPAIYMFYSTAPALGQDQKDPTHTSNFGVKLEEKIKSVGGECELVYPGAPNVKHATTQEYLIEKLKALKARS